jgi:NitT/TauT family transport system ATP-binding protein
MQAELEKIMAETRQTVIFITHSIDEAILLGNRIVVISNRPGTIREVIDVDIPRPRLGAGSDVKRTPRFGEIRSHVWSLLEGQALGTKREGRPR